MKKIRIAVTGGIGSGKTTACNIIRSLGYSVASCDEAYARLLLDESFVLKVCELTQTSPIICDKGHLSIDRDAISKKVFCDKGLKNKLEAFTHPAIINECLSQLAGENGIAFVEVPLLFEAGLEGLFDHVIVVMRPIEDRIASLEIRSGLSRDEALLRINNQFNYEKLDCNGHTVLYNSSSVDELKDNICNALERIVKGLC